MLKWARVCAWVGVCLSLASPVESYILISEVLADPPSGAVGDANGDGVVSSSGDEFVELYNASGETVFLEGWSIADALKERHVFRAGSLIEPWATVLVFGGAEVPFVDPFWYTASTGGLGLNNSGDAVRLYDANGALIDEFKFGPEGGMDVSLFRREPVYASQITPSAAGIPFSPGKTDYEVSMAVPEPSSFFLFLTGLGWAGWRIKRVLV